MIKLDSTGSERAGQRARPKLAAVAEAEGKQALNIASEFMAAGEGFMSNDGDE
jgi:hypothetical protein